MDHAIDRLPEVLSESSHQRRQAKLQRQKRQFVRGPLPMPWLEQATRLPGKALAVGLLIWFMTGLRGVGPIKLSKTLLDRFGVGRKAAGQALTALEQANLIRANRSRGRVPRVEIISEDLDRTRRRHANGGAPLNAATVKTKFDVGAADV